MKYSQYSKQADEQDEPPSTSCFVEDDTSTLPTTSTAHISDDDGDDGNGDSDESVELRVSVDSYTDEPAHIRPFMFQPQYHCGSVHPLNFGHSCPPQLPKCNSALNQQSLWSSVVVLSPNSMSDAHTLSAESDSFGLGLISDFLSL